ncbi:hypothetical protein AAF712_002565 [Marasmius tenuissimus]|uniref:Uncharacterized protein n=1 Tax=Marasmius tenuissimus TaxID=585030 RepID=A0ABR3ABJ5_9AGAR
MPGQSPSGARGYIVMVYPPSITPPVVEEAVTLTATPVTTPTLDLHHKQPKKPSNVNWSPHAVKVTPGSTKLATVTTHITPEPEVAPIVQGDNTEDASTTNSATTPLPTAEPLLPTLTVASLNSGGSSEPQPECTATSMLAEEPLPLTRAMANPDLGFSEPQAEVEGSKTVATLPTARCSPPMDVVEPTSQPPLAQGTNLPSTEPEEPLTLLSSPSPTVESFEVPGTEIAALILNVNTPVGAMPNPTVPEKEPDEVRADNGGKRKCGGAPKGQAPKKSKSSQPNVRYDLPSPSHPFYTRLIECGSQRVTRAKARVQKEAN